jgi:hypothetical protein
VERESSAEGVDANSEVCWNLRSSLGKVLRDVSIFTFLDKESKTATIAWV